MEKRSGHGCPATSQTPLSGPACLAEASWFLVVVLLPSAYQPQLLMGSLHTKTALIGLFGGAMAMACFWALVKGGLRTPPPIVQTVLLCSTALIGCAIVSTFLSLDPWVSFWGERVTQEGLLNLLFLGCLFLGAASFLRTQHQFENLTFAAVLGSVPVILFALLQMAGGDPYSGKDLPEVASFAGSSSYLAIYLLMISPLLIWLCARSWAVQKSHLTSWICFFLLAAIPVVVFATMKRGPWVALLFSLPLLGGMVSLRLRRRWALMMGASLAVTGVLCLAGLAWLAESGMELEKGSALKRLSKIVPMGSKTGDVYRKEIWRTAPSIFLNTGTFTNPDGSQDFPPIIRRAAGHGPETFDIVSAARDPMAARSDFENKHARAHNGFWDLAIAQGLLGVAAWGLFFCAVLTAVFPKKDVSQKSQFARRVAQAFGAGLLLGGACALVLGTGSFGMGWIVGFVYGLFLPVVGEAFFPTGRLECPSWPQLAWISGILAYGIYLAFWFTNPLAAALGAVGIGALLGLRSGQLQPEKVNTPSILGFLPPALGALSAVIVQGLTNVETVNHPSWREILEIVVGIFGRMSPVFFLPAGILISLLCTLEQEAAHRVRMFWKCFFAWWIGAGVALFGKTIFLSISSGKTAEFQPQILSGILVSLFPLLIGALAVVLLVMHLSRKRFAFLTGAVALAGTTVGVLFFVPGMAREATLSLARTFAGAGMTEPAKKAYEISLFADPRSPDARIALAQILAARAEMASTFEEYRQKMNQVVKLLEEGKAYRDFTDINYFLGHYLLRMAAGLQRERKFFASKALEEFDFYLQWSPGMELAQFDRSVAADWTGQNQLAEEYLQTANSAAARSDPLPRAEAYAKRAGSVPQPDLKTAYQNRAMDLLNATIDESAGAPGDEEFRKNALILRGNLFLQKRKFKEGLDDLRVAVRLKGGEQWKVLADLARAEALNGLRSEAKASLEKAITLAPPENTGSLKELMKVVLQP